jgi:uncharacterized protein (TIGR02594 family)
MTNHPILAALRYYGERPIHGPMSNPQIVEFIKATSYPDTGSDEVPWCSAFLVYVFKECGIETPANAAAMSWMTYSVPTDQPSLGDVVVLAWPAGAPTNHHVGLFIRETAELVYILAGNQNDEVDIVAWRKRSVLSYRKLLA